MRNMFLSVGAMKAGTTFLFNVMKQHPDVFFTPEKEVHYYAHIYGLDRFLSLPLANNMARQSTINDPQNFTNPMCGEILTTNFRRNRLASIFRGRFSKLNDPDKLRENVLWYADRYLTDPVDERWLNRIFEGSYGKYCSDFSNYNAQLGATAWNDIRDKISGDLKVIYILRHPVDRLWSHFKFDAEYSGNHGKSQNFSVEHAEALVRNPGISSHSRYGDIVESLGSNLSSDELKIVYFEELLFDPHKVLREIEGFLEIEHFDYSFDLSKKVNPSSDRKLSPKVRERLLQYLRPQLDKLAAHGHPVPDSYYS